MFGNSDTEEVAKVNNSSSNEGATGENNVAFSKIAQHQADADENLFLRFLELDPPVTDNQSRQSSQTSKNNGRTPFTITKKLTKSPEHGFGFSIVWTHPPRIEKVDAGLPAEKSGIIPGDYIIFIDKYNIVTMPELDILNLIRSQGNTLILEIFRRPQRQGSVRIAPKIITSAVVNRQISTDEEGSVKRSLLWSSSAMSNTSLDTTKRRLKLPQVGAMSKESISTKQFPDSIRKRYLIQLINREQHFISAMTFGLDRFVIPLRERKDVISQNDHRTLFQNIDELQQISEDILEQLLQNDRDPQTLFASKVYLSKAMAICVAYKKYCNGLKRADCVLVNKSRTCNSDFMNFISEPPIPKKRPDITTFIHRPLQHFRDILKLIQMIAQNCPSDSEDSKNFTSVVNELQAAYREITVGGGLMEPLGEGRPLLSLQDLESRLVFTKCKPFTLSVPGRQWIFGGDLSRIDGRSVKQFWTLLFSDIIVFAKVSRDRVLFITDDPLPLSNVVDCCFNVRKKNTEFRLTIDPNGQPAKSPVVNCAPDLTRTPLRSARKRAIVLRAPSTELKAVWQNLLTRQIFIVNSTLGSALNSPLESPDIMISQLSDINLMANSIASIKMSSYESINNRRNQQTPAKNGNGSSNVVESNQNTNNCSKAVNSCSEASVTFKENSSITLKSSMKDVINSRRKELKLDTSTELSRTMERFIDEKCNLLNKRGVSKGGTTHLARWMKGQFDKQACASEPIESDDDDEEETNSQEWSVDDVKRRTRELNLNAQNSGGGGQSSQKADETMSEDEQNEKSASKSTTSDSQITVRSSPNNNNNSRSDSISICRQCHKNCKKKMRTSPSSNDNNNNRVKRSPTARQKAFDTSESLSSNTIVEDSRESSLMEDTNLKTSQTMITINHHETQAIETTIKTSHSSPSALHTPKKSRVRMGVRSSLSNHDSTKSSPSVGSLCNCECRPVDFEHSRISPDEIKHEIVKILPDVEQIPNRTSVTDLSSRSSDSPYSNYSCIRARTLQSKYSFLYDNNHMTAAAKYNPVNIIKETMIGALSESDKESEDNKKSPEKEKTPLPPLKPIPPAIQLNGLAPLVTDEIIEEENNEDFDELSLMLVDLAQLNPLVPTIAVLPPTPDTKKTHDFSLKTKDLEITKVNSISISKNESSFDSLDDEEEPPYMTLKTSLRRFGTMSSLERLQDTEDTDEKTFNSSEEENSDGENGKMIPAESTQTFRTWTSRAGSFLEESRAFLDKYLGRTDSGDYCSLKTSLRDSTNDFDEFETIEGETSGATSGEEVWGTPTSGENDEMHMFNGDGNRESPTKSTSSYTGDDDTEIMMDELLMAPIMTTSNIRGLLPRRTLEPLFEEDTDSCDSTNENSLIGNEKQGEEIGKSIVRRQSSNTSIDSDLTTPSIVDEEAVITNQELDLMSPTERQALQDLLSPVEELDLDEVDVSLVTPNDSETETEETPKTTTPVGESFSRVADTCGASVLQLLIANHNSSTQHITSPAEEMTSMETSTTIQTTTPRTRSLSSLSQLQSSSSEAAASQEEMEKAHSRRCLEMKLAMNNDVMSYSPGPDLTSILGHDLSTYHRMNGRDVIMNQIMTRNDSMSSISSSSSPCKFNSQNGNSSRPDRPNSFCGQSNSKMDTPILNRKIHRTWSSSGFVRKDEKTLSDLERLARREKVYAMKLQNQNASDSDSSTKTIVPSNKNKLIKLLRRKSENESNKTSSSHCITNTSATIITTQDVHNHRRISLNNDGGSGDDSSSFTSERMSAANSSSGSCGNSQRETPDKDSSLDRRFWKQLTKRRRSNSVTNSPSS